MRICKGIPHRNQDCRTNGLHDPTGRPVLVVQDDYFLATDTAMAVRGAGAAVPGPCPTEKAVGELLDVRLGWVFARPVASGLGRLSKATLLGDPP